jgi:hypothetical protein
MPGRPAGAVSSWPAWPAAGLGICGSMTSNGEPANRFTLPVPDPVHVGLTTYDARHPDTSFPPVEPVRPPAGAPSVLLILLDDVGFGRPARSAGRAAPRRRSGWRPAG